MAMQVWQIAKVNNSIECNCGLFQVFGVIWTEGNENTYYITQIGLTLILVTFATLHLEAFQTSCTNNLSMVTKGVDLSRVQ